MSLRFGILGFLNYGSMTGYELNKAFGASVDFFWHATTSQIYRELTLLERDSLVSHELVIQTEKPNKKCYSITEEGRQAFLQWLHTPQFDSQFHLRSAFLIQTFFAGEQPLSASLSTIEHFIAYCQQQLDEQPRKWMDAAAYYQQLEDALPEKALFWLFTADFGRRYLETCLAWAKAVKKTLTEKEAPAL